MVLTFTFCLFKCSFIVPLINRVATTALGFNVFDIVVLIPYTGVGKANVASACTRLRLGLQTDRGVGTDRDADPRETPSCCSSRMIC